MKLTSSLLGCSSLNSSKISSVFYRQCGKSSGIQLPTMVAIEVYLCYTLLMKLCLRNGGICNPRFDAVVLQ